VTASKANYNNLTVTDRAMTGGQVNALGTAKVGATLSAQKLNFSPNPKAYAHLWLRDGLAISGATGWQYTLTNADAGHRISVRVDASQDGCTPRRVVSGAVAVANNTAAVAPRITVQPQTKVPAPVAGNRTDFTVEATGSNLRYQWQQWTNGGWQNVPGATGRQYSFIARSEMYSRSYRVMVSNEAGSVFSNNVSIWTVSTAEDPYPVGIAYRGTNWKVTARPSTKTAPTKNGTVTVRTPIEICQTGSSPSIDTSKLVDAGNYGEGVKFVGGSTKKVYNRIWPSLGAADNLKNNKILQNTCTSYALYVDVPQNEFAGAVWSLKTGNPTTVIHFKVS